MRGFTLVELLVAIAIVGVLVAIAIPQYQQYRQHAYENMVRSDVRNAASIEEAYYASTQSYYLFGPVTGPTRVQDPTGTLRISVSEHVTLSAVKDPYSNEGVLIQGRHPGYTSPIEYATSIGSVQ